MESFLMLTAIAAGSFVVTMLYFVIGVIIAMRSVSGQEEYEVCDFIGVLICWPSYLWHKFRDKPWNLGG